MRRGSWGYLRVRGHLWDRTSETAEGGDINLLCGEKSPVSL